MASQAGSEPQPQPRSDELLDLIIGNLLRIGVLVAAVIVLLGGIAFLVEHGGEPTRYHVFSGEPATLTSISGVVRGAVALDTHAVIQLGLLVLIATPIARVVMSFAVFAAQRDAFYVLVTAIVLAILLSSLITGRA